MPHEDRGILGGLIDRVIGPPARVKEAHRQQRAQAAALKPALTPFGAETAKQLGGLLTSGIPAAQSLGAQQLGDLQARQSQGVSFADTQQANQQAGAVANVDAELATKAARLANQKAQLEIDALRSPSTLPDRITLPVLDANGSVTEQTVDSPSSAGFNKTLIEIESSFRGAGSLTELSQMVAQPSGTEFFGPDADRMRALSANAVLGYAQAKGMGALQAPDLELARAVVPDPSGFLQNVEGLTRSVLGFPDAMLGLFSGGETSMFGLSRQDQLLGLREQYRVATDDIHDNIVRTIARNPALLSRITDDQLATIPPDIAAPIIPYLQALGRDPWR